MYRRYFLRGPSCKIMHSIVVQKEEERDKAELIRLPDRLECPMTVERVRNLQERNVGAGFANGLLKVKKHIEDHREAQYELTMEDIEAFIDEELNKVEEPLEHLLYNLGVDAYNLDWVVPGEPARNTVHIYLNGFKDEPYQE